MSDKFNCLLIGESGVGKTPFVATLEACEQTSPCLLLDVDMGSMSIISNPKPTIVGIDSWSKVQGIYALLKKGDWKGLSEKIESEPKEYRSVVIDSGTELEYICRSTVKTELGTSDEAPTQPEYLKTQERMRRLYRAFRDLSLSFVMTAGVRELKDDISGVVKHYPAFQPSLTKDLIRMTDLILFMDVTTEDKKWIRKVQTHLSQRVIARDRSQTLGPIIKGEKLFMKGVVTKVLG